METIDVTQYAVWLPVSDEDIVDFGMGTPEQQAAAEFRILAASAESESRWLALPLTVRIYRTLRGELWWQRDRFHRWLHRDCS